ncbi:ABC transporter permease [Corynebacterium casei]|uniref:ABC transporter permease n=1 Tax=Corynebacterium casei TaxID=160386 RepID=UPI003FCEF58C
MTDSSDKTQLGRELTVGAHRLGEPPQRITLIDDSKLGPLYSRPSFWSYFKQLMAYRHFILFEGRSKANQNGQGTFLGRAWVVLDPLLQTALYVLVFGIILQTSRGMDNFVGFLVLGVVFFQNSIKGLTSGNMLVQKSQGMIASFHFPIAVIPFASAVGNFVNGLVPVIVALIVALLTQPELSLPLSIIGIFPLYVFVHLFGLGCILWSARVTAMVPDFKSFVSVATRALFFLSGVFFTIDRFDGHDSIQTIVKINPIYQFLASARTLVLDGSWPSFAVWGYMLLWAIAFPLTGLIYFWAGEDKYALAK